MNAGGVRLPGKSVGPVVVSEALVNKESLDGVVGGEVPEVD